MARDAGNLVAQIEKDALDEDVSLASALRKCIVLGGKSGSEKLRDWATRELQGYPNIEDLPDYRVIAAPLRLDGFSGNYKITGEELPPMALPEFARENISNDVKLNDGVGMLENLAKQPEIKLAPPGASNLALYMNSKSDNPYRHINSIYWAVSPSAIKGVLDQIRTALTQLVGELRASTPRGEEVPSAEAADQAVNVMVTGKRSHATVTVTQAAGGATATTSTGPEDTRFWTRWRKIGAFTVGAATVAGAVVAIIELL